MLLFELLIFALEGYFSKNRLLGLVLELGILCKLLVSGIIIITVFTLHRVILSGLN